MIDQQKLRLTAICSSDRRMDILDTRRMLDTPVNTYEVSCARCSFPNIDKTPKPYFIAKGRDFSGIEVMEADMGNLFVSDRVKRIFETLCPDQCVYERTYTHQSVIPTKWWLAIPNTLVINGEVKDNIKRCKVCNQPLHAHPGTQYKFWHHEIEAPADIAKASNWHSTDEHDWKNWWIGRDVFLSLRLISLLKKISAKGFEKLSLGEKKYKSLNTAEERWVEQAIVTIGNLKDNLKFEVTPAKLDKFKLHFSVTNMPEAITSFEKKFKVSANEIAKVICSIKSGTQIDLGFDSPFVIEDVQNWESTKTKSKLVAFAFDKFGNNLLFNPTDKNCPLYFYDHETMLYDLIQLSILNLTNP